jgi:chromosome partitioning protein
MTILVVGGIKGGTGKTTISTNLVVMRSKKKERVLFVDADEICCSYDWVNHRLASDVPVKWDYIRYTGILLKDCVRENKKKYTDIIIDVGGRDTVSQRSCLSIADIFLVPLRPRCQDLWSVNNLEEILMEAVACNKNLKIFGFLNQADPKGQDNEDAIKLLQDISFNMEIMPNMIVQRKSFHNAFSCGLSVIELDKKDKKAISELEELYKNIYT